MARTQVASLGSLGSTAGKSVEGDLQAFVRRAQLGDLAAFETLVRETQGPIAAVVSRILNSPDDVDDLVQDVYIQAFQHLRSFRGDARFSTWIHRIAVNMALKRLKQIRRKTSLSLDDPDTGLAETLESETTEAPPEVVLLHEREKAIREAVSHLSDKHRIVVMLRFFDDYSCEEIAESLGCSVGTVWSRLHYACKQLRKTLDWVME